MHQQNQITLARSPEALDITSHSEKKLSSGTLGNSPAVRAAAHRALAARDLLLSGYPDWEDWRRQARASKLEAVSRLDELLEKLIKAVTSWGGQVLRAVDAAQARRQILAIAKEHGVKTVVKSKSMTTEEIELNPDLIAAGFSVIETDLGEFIVQLAGHPPAHLTAPALHLNRHQIAQIFAEHLGESISPNPEALTRWATTYINPHFFKADMGITGVNFATPEGSFILLENESNLRFTATLPKVHVAVMGLEKIIPRLADVEAMLRLLPASATGQRLTALVHFIQGLKFQPEGNQLFYLVLLDNGRRQLAADPEMAEALCCLRCGACLNTCPIFQVGAAHRYRRVYPGAIGILLAPYLAPEGDICDLCTQCGACQDICPVGIHLQDKIQVVRSRSRRFQRVKGLSAIAGALLCHPRWYRSLEPALHRASALLARQGWGRGVFPLSEKSFYRQQIGSSSLRKNFNDLGEFINEPSMFQMNTQNHENILVAEDFRLRCTGETPVPPKTFSEQESKGALGKYFLSPVSQAEELEVGLEESNPALDSSTPDWTDESNPAIMLLAQRLSEAKSSLIYIRGPIALAQRLSQAEGPLWLEDHPWLREVAAKLSEMGVKHQIAEYDWIPEAGTAVSVALGAIPETGSVIVDSGGGPAAVLAFRAKNQIILIPSDKANLSLSQALTCVEKRAPGMLTWLTGPSRTADIEKVLVLGAQGPVTLEMILYRERE